MYGPYLYPDPSKQAVRKNYETYETIGNLNSD